MPPKKSWAQIRRAGLESRRAAFKSMPAKSAFNTLTSRNLENTTAGYMRRVEAEANENPQPAPVKKTKAKAAPKPKKNKIEKPKKAIKARSTRTKKKQPVLSDDEEEEEEEKAPAAAPPLESWRPYRDSPALSTAQPTRVLGIGRIAAFQYEAFKQEFEDKFGAYADVQIVAEEVDGGGGEQLVDLRVEWADEDIAEMMRGEIEGEVVAGRRVQCTFVM